jgi:long-subunit acyl-CoA synthetase (AMP-forming)
METLKNIPKNIKEIQPTILMSVPAIAKNFRKGIETAIRQKGKMAQKLFEHALKTLICITALAGIKARDTGHFTNRS